jgi:plasmid stabilization system protein ParE
MMRVVFHREALEEITSSADYYEGSEAGLRVEFTEELERAAERIRESPDAWPVLTSGIRRYLLHRFPFSIIYTVSEDYVLILAVMHFRRKPGYWKHRLKML